MEFGIILSTGLLFRIRFLISVDEQLIKLSLLSCVYNILDLTFYCLSVYDNRYSLTIAKDWILKITKG